MSLILESREKLKHINPWRIDLVEELRNILNLFQKETNFIIAGYAADNASFIYKRKIDTIERIAKGSRSSYNKGGGEIFIKLPDIKVEPLIGRSYIDISSILDRLEEVIENRLRATTINEEEASEITEYYSDTSNIEEKAREIGVLIQKAYRMFRKRLLLSDIIKTLDAYSPYLIIFTILFLYVEEEIDIDIIEEDGIAKDIIITPAQ